VIRAAGPGDVPALHALIRELARYEKLEDQHVGTQDALREHLFGARRYCEALVASSASADSDAGADADADADAGAGADAGADASASASAGAGSGAHIAVRSRAQLPGTVASAKGRVVGFALFFHNYSTFLARPGLYLEDLFVLPDERRHGYGRELLRALARIAVERGCGRFEWSVLHWNEPAIRFYKALGATPLDEWGLFRLTGDALAALAGEA
jgi:GNAT superfamily N-acetyltransferase